MVSPSVLSPNHVRSGDPDPGIESGEDARLGRLYESLRERLLDLTNRNPMLNTRGLPAVRSRRLIQIVDGSLEAVYARLTGDEPGALDILPLADPGERPADELTDAFVSAFEHARLTDSVFLAAIEALDGEADNDAAIANAEEALRLRLRAELGLSGREPHGGIDRAAHATALGIDPTPDLAIAVADMGPPATTLQTLIYQDDLDIVLDRIADSARLAMQETGLSTLFLVIGFLERPDPDRPGKLFRAPLILLPVRLVTRHVEGREIRTIVADAGAETNLSLMRLVERDHRRVLPPFEPEATEDEGLAAIGPIARYLAGVTRAIDGLKGWRVRPWLVLGTFTFGRFQIYQDLDAANWPVAPVSHALVRAILAGTDRPGGDVAFGPMPDYDIDAADIDGEVPYLIADADASQHSALIDVARGKSLVIEGPPGTGKSQTIANIIAHAMGQGKKVLFLAEKQAALTAVRARLETAGLGAFCLELHSDAAVPRTVIAALKARADLGWGRPQSARRGIDPALADARRMIGTYVSDLNRPQADGATPFDLIWAAIRGARGEEPTHEALRHLSPSGDWLNDANALKQKQDLVQVYALSAAEFEARHGPVGASPWSRTGLGDIAAYDFLRVRAALMALREPIAEAVSLNRAGADFGLMTLADLKRLIDVAEALGPLPSGTEPALVALGQIFVVDTGDDGSARLRQWREALERLIAIAGIAARMAATPDLAGAARRTTALADELIQSRFGDALTASIPLDLNRAIRTRVADTGDLIAAIGGLLPAVAAIGLDSQGPADGFTEIALLARALSGMQAARRTELTAYLGISPADVDAAVARRDDLLEALADWKTHFPGLDAEALPTAEDLRLARDQAARGGVSRLIGALSREARRGRAVLDALQVPGRTVDPALIDQLAGFVVYCEAFADDPRFRQRFGPDWRGINTPFAAIEGAIRLRRAFRQAVAQASGGGAIVDALLAAGADAVEAIGRLRPEAERFLSLPATVRARVQGLTLGSAIPQLEAEIRTAAGLSALASDDDLLRLDRPLGLIAGYHRLREDVTVLKHELAGLAEAGAVIALVEDGDPLPVAAAVDWILRVRDTDLPSEAQDALTGRHAAAVSDRLQGIADQARLTLARLAAASAELEAGFGRFNLDAGDPAGLLARIDALIAGHGQLGDFLALRRMKLDLAADGLGAFLDTVERLQVPMTRLPELFQTLVAQARAEGVRRSTAVGGSTGLELDVRRRIFAERDRERIATDRAELRARLTEMAAFRPIPGNNIGPKSAWTEMALLNTEFQKSGRHPPVRALMARAGRSIQALMPCVMAAPLSLAKFLPPGKLRFDLLVIDEASQMRPEDALGGLLRADQLVVVGDTKQLPPTDFFRRADPDRAVDDDDDEIDAESVLEICARTFHAVRRLTWHYRSRCESLIAFSNQAFYGGSLITFPNSRPGAFAIDLVRVNGTYHNRRNGAEAVRMAEEAVRFMRHHADDAAAPTLGLATLNLEQRELIAAELRRISAGDERVAAYMARVEGRGEPVFVKNLENLQGDERDVILVSLVRGPTAGAETIAQTFGPMGGRHGARRLNVLVTRARRRIVLFASFGSDDVRPGETSPAGVHALKQYLAYVEERGRAPGHADAADPDSDFELDVADRLREAGFEVEYQVGVSRFRIDIGVRHPDRPQSFLAGIECDGARYHSSASARDRDRLREEVLAGLGWQLIRVWSTDWFADQDGETRRLVRRLDLMRMLPDHDGDEYRFGLCEGLKGVDGAGSDGSAENPVVDGIEEIGPHEAAIDDERPGGELFEHTHQGPDRNE